MTNLSTPPRHPEAHDGSLRERAIPEIDPMINFHIGSALRRPNRRRFSLAALLPAFGRSYEINVPTAANMVRMSAEERVR